MLSRRNACGVQLLAARLFALLRGRCLPTVRTKSGMGAEHPLS